MNGHVCCVTLTVIRMFQLLMLVIKYHTAVPPYKACTEEALVIFV